MNDLKTPFYIFHFHAWLLAIQAICLSFIATPPMMSWKWVRVHVYY